MSAIRLCLMLKLILAFSLLSHFSPIIQSSILAQQPVDGVVDGSRLPTGRLIQPAGKVLEHPGRPVDLAFSESLNRVFVKAHKSLWIVDPTTLQLRQEIAIPGGASLYGITVTKDDQVLVTDAKNSLHVFGVDPNGTVEKQFKLLHSIALPVDCFPCGIALSKDHKQAFVCLSKKNSLAIVDLDRKKVVSEIAVGIAPFDVVVTADSKRAVVSNIGGRRAIEGDNTATSAGTKTVVDKRGIANNGTISIVDLAQKSVEREVQVGRQPSVLTLNAEENQVTVCNTNEDSVSIVNLDTGETTFKDVKPDGKLPFGSMPSCIARSPDKQFSFVALAGNNAVLVLDKNDEVLGRIPTGWYPASIVCSKTELYIGNVKGSGSRSRPRDKAKGLNSHDHLGSIQRIPLKDLASPKTMTKWTDQVSQNGRIPQTLRAMMDPIDSSGVEPNPVPEKLGQPSVFKHVIYVIKENRTFDQVFGDVKEARSEPGLCTFPKEITPNHHALAERFGLLDNYYCNGVLSADGHSWATEGNVTPYLERAFGGFARSYTFGDDPITYSSSGFIWDRFLAAGLSFRNYGEMDYAKPPAGMKYVDIYQAYVEGKAIEFSQNIGIERLRKYSCRDYPGWNMMIPDVLRMDRFLKEFREFETNDGLPSLTLIYLPQDHLGGGITSRSHMADNDLAVGRLVEAVSHSKYWDDTVIFINEDDPQNGYDHIDGHRSLCLVVSKYSKPGVNHNFYNQTSVLRTILHLFGLPPMNQQDASMPLMTACFQSKATNAPYDAIAANYPLNELPAPKKKQATAERQWRAILATVPIERTGMKTEQDEDNLNRFVWHEMKGWDTPYPVQWSGAHGRGLKALGLVFGEEDRDK